MSLLPSSLPEVRVSSEPFPAEDSFNRFTSHSYGVDDDPDIDALSLRTTSSNYKHDDLPELPSYSDSEAAVAESSAGPASTDVRDLLPDSYPALKQPAGPSRGWQAYRNNKPVDGNETTIRMDERLVDPLNLFYDIPNYLQVVPPNPSVRIVGHHYQTVRRENKKETEKVTDFNIMLSLQAYLPKAGPPRDGQEKTGWDTHVAGNSDKVYRGSWRPTRAAGYQRGIEVGDAPQHDLEEWCRHYCASKSKLKIFRVTRDVPGIDQDFIRQHIEHLIRSTHYPGHITITFPIDQKHVDLYSPHWINRWRSSWIRFIFYFTFLWIITWPILFFMTKYWTVYQVNFRFFLVRWAVISEKAWFEKHQALIRSLVLDRFQGDATHMPTDIQVSEGPRDGRSANMDAVNLLQHSVDALNMLQGRAPRIPNEGWGADTS
ncbi:hypothetical protein Tdes44962_MAKER09007 [Teratosphaeria destructans]|uniref:Uncharacterized protein n=1 Tax=Teratosphaeria destructans TaxID=418781 RepID=A0A9W7W3Z8_9PEZI|nr:hypothetical protein Tdes44962_MAKER09007 [Teratosphaeria destructans]